MSADFCSSGFRACHLRQLEGRKRLLDETTRNLQNVEEDRSQLDVRLQQALANIARLGEDIDDLTAQKNKMETDLTTELTQTRQTLEGDKAKLTEQDVVRHGRLPDACGRGDEKGFTLGP